MSRNPIAMYPVLVARSDNSTDAERPRAPGCVVDCHGNPVERPDLHPELNALEGNPNLMYEHWDEFWRKVHGACAFYKDTPDDDMEDCACSYYQIHRMAGAPSSNFPPPYQAPVDENGSMYPYLWDKVPAYHRPKFDGLVYWGAKTIKELIPIGYNAKAVNKFNAQGNIFNKYWAGSMAAEYIIIPLEGDLPPICTVKVHYRKEGTQEELQQYLLKEHSDVIANGEMAKKYMKRFAYIFNINKSPAEPFYNESGVKVDAISVSYFANMGDCEAYYGSDEYRAIQEKENAFLAEDSEWWTGIIYPFAYPRDEVATDRDAECLAE